MDRQYIRDHQVIERYLRGTLSPDEERAFEETYVGDPDLVEEIELVERLRQGVKDVGAATIKPQPARRAWLSALGSPQWAAAASVLLVVSLVLSGTLYRENLNLRQGDGLLVSATTATRFFQVVTVRGGESESVYDAPGADDLAIMLVDPGLTAHDTYRAVVSRRSDDGSTTEIWRADRPPQFQDQLAISMPGRLLTPGEYEIRITGRMNDWPADRPSEEVGRNVVRIAVATDNR